jgi:hypothetical protein
MTSSGLWVYVVLVRINVSNKRVTSTFRVEQIREWVMVGSVSLATSNNFLRSRNISTLKTEAIFFSETSVFATLTLRNVPEDVILHSHRCENITSYKKIFKWIYCHVLPRMWYVVGLITLRGFGLVTGFIRSGDLQLHKGYNYWLLTHNSQLNTRWIISLD